MEQHIVDMIQTCMTFILAFYFCAVLLLFLLCFTLNLMDKYGFKWKYFGKKK